MPDAFYSIILKPRGPDYRTSSGNYFPTRHAFVDRRVRALESVLLSVLSALEAEMVFIRNLVGGLLAELDDTIDHDRFKRLLHHSRRLASFQSRAKLVSTFRIPDSFLLNAE